MYLGKSGGSASKGKGSSLNTLARNPRSSKGKAIASRSKSGPKRTPQKQWPFRDPGLSNPHANIRGCH